MKTLYLDCGMGAAGDMLTAALLELMPDPDASVLRLNSLGIPDVEFVKESSEKCGIVGTRVSVRIHGAEEGEHGHDGNGHGHSHGSHGAHRGMDGIRHIVKEHSVIPEKVASDILNVYKIIADAESRVHDVPVDEIHFHEVGQLDAIADIAAVCMLINELSPDEIAVSPVHVGSGKVECAHGILPVPAPATALILQGAPIYGGDVEGELCTPTGAALLKYFATRFGKMPVMSVSKIGYGMGKKDFQAANCVRAFLGESDGSTDTVVELSCNVDDMTGEEIGFAVERLFEGGALDVYTTPIGMKKNRPGTLICAMCNHENKDALVRIMFRHTSTAGVRERTAARYVLDRTIRKVPTPYGEVSLKEYSGYGVKREKYEYDDIARIARENGLSLAEARDAAKK